MYAWSAFHCCMRTLGQTSRKSEHSHASTDGSNVLPESMYCSIRVAKRLNKEVRYKDLKVYN
jgi:hypothetical protein